VKLLFVSTQGAVRGIMAEAIAKRMSKEALLNIDIYSAGVEPALEISMEVIEVLKEKGYSIDIPKPRGLRQVPYKQVDVLITLSPEARDSCPYVQYHKRREHWNLEEVKDIKNAQALRKLRDQIEENIKTLFKIR